MSIPAQEDAVIAALVAEVENAAVISAHHYYRGRKRMHHATREGWRKLNARLGDALRARGRS